LRFREAKVIVSLGNPGISVDCYRASYWWVDEFGETR
jgi:hypothetical protein